MFNLYTLEDNVRIEAKDLGKPTELAIAHVLEQNYVDKVIHDVGLVITLYDVLKVGEGAVFHSDGGVHYKVVFRIVVFRPFPGELLVGVVKQMDEHGVHVSLGFFQDIIIQPELLQQPAVWQESSSEWVWAFDDPPNSPPLYYTRGEEIRVKVHAVRYHHVPSLATQAEQKKAGLLVEGTAARPHVPMEVVARVDNTGLGMIGWAWG